MFFKNRNRNRKLAEIKRVTELVNSEIKEYTELLKTAKGNVKTIKASIEIIVRNANAKTHAAKGRLAESIAPLNTKMAEESYWVSEYSTILEGKIEILDNIVVI